MTTALGLGAAAIVIVAAIVLLTMSRDTGDRNAAASQSASPTLTASSTGSTTAGTASATPSSPAATPRGQYVNAKYGYALTLPDPYRVSTALTRESPPIQCCGGEISKKQAAQRDVFTAFTPADEQAAMVGQDCEQSCMAWNGTAVAYIFTDAGSMTPRQWLEAGNGPGSPGPATDVTLGGRPAVKMAPAGRYEVMYVVADGKGRMFHVAYELFHVGTPPPGATREKLDQLLLSFRLA
jgi:hypothetical protein